MKGDACFSPDRKYRYMLSRTWADGFLTCLFICLNASTADAERNDPTITRGVGFARDWGFSRLLWTNIFGLRSNDPKRLYSDSDPIGPENDTWIMKSALESDFIVVGWGEHGVYRNRGRAVLEMLNAPAVISRAGRPHCFALNKSGQPRHPLYLPRTARPEMVSTEWLGWKREELRTPEMFKKMYMGEFLC